MATTAGTLSSKTFFGKRAFFVSLALLGLLIGIWSFFYFNYWFAVICIFLSLLVLIGFSLYKTHPGAGGFNCNNLIFGQNIRERNQ